MRVFSSECFLFSSVLDRHLIDSGPVPASYFKIQFDANPVPTLNLHSFEKQNVLDIKNILNCS
jgi:hypothetical protein